MEPGPIPPHERTWRHPSELGPRASDIGPGSSFSPHTVALVLASGSLAVMIIVAIVVTATPRTSSQPVSLSATTMPAFISAAAQSIPSNRPPGSPGTRIADPSPLLVSFMPIPNEIASAPQLAVGDSAVADELPEAGDPVVVQTEDATYLGAWADIRRLEIPDGAVVIDVHGDLVARVVAGELIELVAD